MLGRPTRFTLFPYTTLFRSRGDLGERRRAAPAPAQGDRIARRGDAALCPAARADAPQDRKSTRLNSSHSQISYAVLCLKKKKQSPIPTSPLPSLATRRESCR